MKNSYRLLYNMQSRISILLIFIVIQVAVGCCLMVAVNKNLFKLQKKPLAFQSFFIFNFLFKSFNKNKFEEAVKEQEQEWRKFEQAEQAEQAEGRQAEGRQADGRRSFKEPPIGSMGKAPHDDYYDV